MFAGNFAPKDWAFCHGQILPISTNQALFSILGTIYGGDGRTTFALPDLRGRGPLGAGAGPGLTERKEGQKPGVETVILKTVEIPAHNHMATALSVLQVNTMQPGNSESPLGTYFAVPSKAGRYASTQNTNMGPIPVTVTIHNTGANLPHENMQPSQVVNFIICLSGVFPSRS
jgi:microcystin-dependent protein